MYPLALSVINDAASYEARKHAARKLLEGYYDADAYRRAIRAVCVDKAREERAAFGVKIKPSEISAQAREVAARALSQQRDAIREGYTGGRISATIRRWFDKVNGNSYFVVWLTVPQSTGPDARMKAPFKYGYGDQPAWETVEFLCSFGLFEKTGNMPSTYPIDFSDDGYMPRRTL